MKTAEVSDVQGGQIVKLPEEFRLQGSSVSVRKSGDAVILEPMRPVAWPPRFFNEILIDDAAFVRPEQAPMPMPGRQ